MRDLFFSALEAALSAARYHLEGHDALALSALEQAEASIKAIQGELLSVKTGRFPLPDSDIILLEKKLNKTTESR